MISSIFKDNTRLDYDIDIATVTEYFYCPALMVNVRIDGDPNLIEGEKYRLKRVDNNQIYELLFYQRQKENKVISFKFVDEYSFKVLNNIYTADSDINGVKIEDYINGSKDLLNFYLLNMRKLGVVNTINNTKPELKHLQEIKTSKALSFELNLSKISRIDEKRKQNYFSIMSSESVINTENGEYLSNFIPFLSQSDINGLNSFVVPSLKIEVLGLEDKPLGSKITYRDVDYFMLEKRMIQQGKLYKTLMTLGVLL